MNEYSVLSPPVFTCGVLRGRDRDMLRMLTWVSIVCFRIAMSESIVASRPVTRAATKRSDQNYSTQPITWIAAVRDKCEKPRGHFGKFKKSIEEAMALEDDSFASVPAFPIEYSYIGSQKNGPRPAPHVGTPIQELRARAASVRVALEASMPKPPIMPTDFEGRELALAEGAAQS